MSSNLDQRTVDSFGDEWSRFDQDALPEEEERQHFDAYFRVLDWDALPKNARAADIGCGTGRWAKRVAPRVHQLTLVDASPAALEVARANLSDHDNCEFVSASVGDLPLEDASLDLVYSLGVLHHVPDTAAAISACAQKLKPGAPLVLYLYYRFDNRPLWFRGVWKASDILRGGISRLPARGKAAVCDLIAAGVYFPLAKGAALAERLGADVENVPLSFYRNTSFYTMRTDSRDRFGTPLEQRFTQAEIRDMMERAGLRDIAFSEGAPYWCAVGYRRA